MRDNWQHVGDSLNTSPQQRFHQHPHQQLRAGSSSAQVQKDVVAFIEAFRANQSSPSTPPNALTLDIVVRAICNFFHVNAFEDLMGTSALQLPALRQLHTVNQRVWTFVTCFLQSRRIHTLYECHQAFLQHEGLRSFHELKIGNSFLHTEAVQQLYQSPPVLFTITTRNVLTCLRQFEDLLGQDAFRASSHVDLHEFLLFLAQQYRQPSARAMGVFIDPHGFGVYVGLLRRVANHEVKELKTLEQQFQGEIAEKMFRLTKEKFSDENRKRALGELLEQVNARTKTEESAQTRRGGNQGSIQSLSLDMLKRVTDVDVYLDNLLCRKAAANAKASHHFNHPISSQEIAEIDLKLRNQLTRFIASSQKSKHYSRLKVVTWVICSIMAKTYALLLNDDKFPTDDENGTMKILAESDTEECDCCCVGKHSCTCSCTCKCHVESSDEEDEGEDENLSKKDKQSTISSNVVPFPVSPADPFATTYAKLNKSVNVTLEDVKTEVVNFLKAKRPRDEPQTAKDVLLIVSSLEKHLISIFAAESNDISWAGRRSVLELLPELIDDAENGGDLSAAKCLSGLMQSIQGSGECGESQQTKNKKLEEEMLPFVRQCRATIASSSLLSSLSSEKQQQWIAHRLLVEFEGAHIELKSFFSAETIEKAPDQDTSNEGGSVVKYAGSLDLNFDNSGSCEDATGKSSHLLTEQALVKLRKCPFLINVALYMNWQERYAPLCGPLLSFLRVHEMILLDHAPSNNLLFVCCTNGTIVRVNEKSTPSDVELLLRQAEQEKLDVAASQVALHLVSMVVKCKGRANFPQQLVQAHLRAYLVKVDDKLVKRLVVEILMETPVEFADFVLPLLLDAIGHDARSDFVDQIWRTCTSDAERKSLLFLSNRSSLSLWTNQTNEWCSVRANVTDACNANDASIIANGNEKDAAENKAALSFDAAYSSVEDKSKAASPTSTSALEEPSFTSVQDVKNVSCTNIHTRSCQSFIEKLRKKQFGVGLETQDEATTSLLLIQQQRLERALKRLSDELYSASTHFVLELLQNADDNTYDDTVTPLGEFTLTSDKEIVFYNNEQGFSSANIQAICDVGASTKTVNDLEASIGKKGIGFKSVFKVSDNPQVHSNGFHICFHAKNTTHGNGVGYILPYWLDDTTQWKRCRGTTFVLPLNESSVQRMETISQSLLALEPSVLLFLRRIQELRLCDSARQHTLHFLKKEMNLYANATLVHLYTQVKTSDNNVEVTHRSWLIVKETLKVPQMFARKCSTEIALAFPISFKEKLNKQHDRPPLQDVFCYLPLRSYGFRFILQGDFEIPSSREAITSGSEWNEWLISKFPQLVSDAVKCYVLTLQTKDISTGISHLLSLLPLENEVQTPFRSIVPEIMRHLRQVKWLSSATPLTPSELLKPAELIDGINLTRAGTSESTNELLKVLSVDVLGSTFNKRLLHPALSLAMSGSMKNQLRIEQLQASHLMRVLSLSAEKNDIVWTVNVLALLAQLWRNDRHSSLLHQELRLVRCFPLQQNGPTDGNLKWISLADGHDSLYVSDVQAGNDISKRRQSYSFFSDLWILDDTFTNAVSENLQLRAFLLNDLGLHVMDDHEIIRHHILPKMTVLCSRAEDYTTDTVEIESVIEYGQFLASHQTRCRNCTMFADVKANMIVATDCGRLMPINRQNLFAILPSTFRKMAELVAWIQSKSKGCDQAENALAIVSDSYCFDNDTQTSWKSSDEQWQHFFTGMCGVSMLLNVATLKSDESAQAGMKQLLVWIEAEKDNVVKRKMSTLLAQHMDKRWKKSKGDDRADSKLAEDAACHFWQQYRWLEGSDSQFHYPCDLWLTTDETTHLFSSSMVTFSSTVWKSDEFSKHVLGMKSTATVTDVLSVLLTITEDSTLVRLLDYDKIIRLYTFLWEESQRSDGMQDKVTSAFSKYSMIFVSAKDSTEHTEPFFTSANNAVWTSAIQQKELVVLKTLYPTSLRNFFIKVCGVQRKPSVSFLCKMLSEQQAFLTTKRDRKVSEVQVWRKKMLPLLSALSKKVKKRSLSNYELKEIKKTLKLIPWLPVLSVSGSSCVLAFCRSKDQPVQATTENERKLQKLAIALIEEIGADSGDGVHEGKKQMEEEIKLVPLEHTANDADLNALLDIAKVLRLSTHLKSHANTWCKVLARLTKSCQEVQKKSRKKLIKFSQLLVRAWAEAFSSGDDQEMSKFRTSIQHLAIFPTMNKKLHWASGANMYINDQTELFLEDLLEAGQAGQLQVLGLFPWSYFVNGLASEEDSSDVTLVRHFLMKYCGLKSLQAHLQVEISVLSTQHPASDAFHTKIHTAFAVAQRFLFHCHRNLYDQLPHDSLAKLASNFQCILVDGHDGFQVVYRVGSIFSHRRGIDGSCCFFDHSNSSMYLQSVTGDEEASMLSVVLMELSRKLFGAQVAANVANILYLSLLQPNAFMREQWLLKTQRLSPLPPSETDKLWAQQLEVDSISSLSLNGANHKRAFNDMEDGEIASAGTPQKKVDNYSEQSDQEPKSPSYSSLSLSNDGTARAYGMQMHKSLHPQFSSTENSSGASYHMPRPLSSSNTEMQFLSLSNTMTKKEREAIGRWGEEYVFNQLKRQHARNNVIVEWVNEKEESGLPYDLKLSSGGKVEEYIEVKSTRTMEKGAFEISMNELDQAAIHGSTYCIYRVFNAGNFALCRVVRLKNPVSLVRQRKIQLALIMQ